MRVKCCKCGCKFDIPVRAVLEEAERIKGRSKPAVATDGNALAPGDIEGRRTREEAIKRRSPKNI